MQTVLRRTDELPAGFAAEALPSMPWPKSVLMCPPDYFDVIDVKNPFMEGQVGKVEKSAARRQWEELKGAFETAGLSVQIIPARQGREDMVFCANQTLPGLDAKGRKVCVLSHMKHPSRQKEVPAFAEWFSAHGYQVAAAGKPESLFEGCGDAVWHPGRRLLWGGWGHRTDPEIYPEVSRLLGVPVLALELKTRRFYHLDTCFCPIDEKTVLVYPPSLTPAGMKLIGTVFSDVVEVDEREAMENMACNAAAFFGKRVVLQKGSPKTVRALRDRGFETIEVETGEYMKSGGSVFCLKMSLF